MRQVGTRLPELTDGTPVGFSMGGGEAARCISRLGETRLRSAVRAAAVSPYLQQTADNHEGSLVPEAPRQMEDDGL
jgi:hypothetical protein